MSLYLRDMLSRLWALAGLAGAIVGACTGTDFAGGGDGAAGDSASAGEPTGGSAGANTSGGVPADTAGSASVPMGEAGEGGAAGGAPGVPPPSIAIVQKTRTGIVGNADPSLTLTTPPTAGNALIVGITCFSEVDNCVIPEGGVTDNQGNLYRLVIEGASIVSSDTHGSRPYLFITENIPAPTGPLTITVNPNGTPPANYQNFAWGVLEVAGLAPNSVDQTGDVPNTCCFTSTTVTTNGPTTSANELAVAVHAARSNDNDFNYMHETGWVEQHVNNDGVSLASQHSLVTRVLTEPGTISHTWTHDEPSRGVSAIIATFRGAAP